MSLTSIFTDIADAIRAKTGKTAAMTPAEMVTEIGSIKPDQTPEVMMRGESTTTPDIILDLSQCNRISQYACYRGTSIKEITLPETATYFGQDSFFECSNMEVTNDVLNASEIKLRSFASCSNVDFKKIICQGTIATNAFNKAGLTTPKVWAGQISMSFANCTQMTYVWISKTCTSIVANSFYGCTNLVAICTDADEKPSGWVANWDLINSGGVYATVMYGVSEAEFDELIGGSGT